MTRVDPTFARDVAKQLDRRRMRRRLVLWTALLALVAAAAMYLRCGGGSGLGLGGAGKGEGPGPGSLRPLAGPRPCLVRVSRDGITVDGKPMLRDEAVAACKAAEGAELLIVGDVPHGEGEALRDAFRTANVPYREVHKAPGAGAPAAPAPPAPDK